MPRDTIINVIRFKKESDHVKPDSRISTTMAWQYNAYGLLEREIVSPRCCRFGKSHLTVIVTVFAYMCETKRSCGDKGTP